MANIEATIQRIAQEFVQEVVKALVGSSIQEFAQLAGKSGGARRASTAAPAAPARRGAKTAARAPAKAPAGKGRKASSASKRNRRSTEEIETLTEQIISHIRDNSSDYPDGISVSELAKNLKVGIEDITRPIHRAVSNGNLKKKGEKRLTRYFPGKG